MAQETGGTSRHALLDHVPEMVTISDRRGRILYANPATERVSGFAPKEFVSLDPFPRMHPDDRARCEEAFAELLRNPGLILELEHRVRHKDGSWRWVEGTFASLFEDPAVGGLLATVRDVTEHKRAEAKLRESEERQAFLLRLSDALRPLGDPVALEGEACRLLADRLDVDRAYYVEVDEEAGLARVGRDFVRDGAPSLVGEHPVADFSWSVEILGRGECHVVSDTQSSSLVPPADRPASAALGIIACMGAPLVKAGRLVGALCVTDPHPREWSESEVELLREVGERVRGAIERARTEEALHESEEKYRTLFETMGQGYCDLELLRDAEGRAVDQRYLELNPAYERLIGIPVADAKGRTASEVMPELEHRWTETFDRIARRGEPERIEYEVASLGRWFEVFVYPRGSDRLTVLYEDTTERKRAEEERRQLGALAASARAEDAERERISRELHDRVAHTMGVAHQSLELYSALARSSPERAREKLELARDSIRTALDETRDLSAQLARCQTEETQDGLTSALGDLLQTHLPDGVEGDLSAEGDEAALPPLLKEQAYLVMREAVRNAVSHSGCRRIGVMVEVEGGEFRGRVEDDGEGFDQDEEDTEGDDDGGTSEGVGLRSMRERTEMLEGRLEISSHPGGGTAVEVRIPLAN